MIELRLTDRDGEPIAGADLYGLMEGRLAPLIAALLPGALWQDGAKSKDGDMAPLTVTVRIRYAYPGDNPNDRTRFLPAPDGDT